MFRSLQKYAVAFALVFLTTTTLAGAQSRQAPTRPAETTGGAVEAKRVPLRPGLDPEKVERYRLPADQDPETVRNLPPLQRAVDGADDPAGLLAAEHLPSLTTLASRLSEDRGWMLPEVLRMMAIQDLRLDELFVDAPEVLRFGGAHYRVKLQQVGGLWTGFDPAVDPFVVFLSHEVYDGLGEERALAFRDGAETVLFAHDFESIPALSITLVKLAPGEAIGTDGRIAPLAAPISLGAAELRVGIDRLPPELIEGIPGLDTLSKNSLRTKTCTQEVKAASCGSNFTPVCPSGYKPFFALSALKIKVDHEGCCFKGNSEIELYPLRMDISSPAGSVSGATTNLIFDGRTVTDLAGRSRYLPDVNNVGSWYYLAKSVAIFPMGSNTEFSALLVEDDDDTGVLRVDRTKVNVTKLFETLAKVVYDYRQIDFFYLVKTVLQLIDILGLLNDGDDLYQQSIGVGSELYCTNGVSQAFPWKYTYTSSEWDMQGYFVCIDSACPDPSTGGGGGGGGVDECSNLPPGQYCP